MTIADDAERALLARQVALANEAMALVLADLHRTTSVRVAVVIDGSSWSSVRMTFEDCSAEFRLDAVEQPEAIAEMAAFFLEQYYGPVIDGNFKSWPACRSHDVGLHPEVHDGRAVWWCQLGQHEAAPIGELDLDG